MVKTLYLDGCSMVYGFGLNRDQSLGNLFKTQGGYEVDDYSRPGKSNLAIVLDAYKNYKNFDIIVLGFTWSSRFYIKYHDQHLDFYPGTSGRGFDIDPMELDLAHQEVYKYFYTVYGPPYCDDLSDMLIDNLLAFLIQQKKQFIAFSWEPRTGQNPVHYPYIAPKDRLSDGHLNARGMIKLYEYLQNLLA